MATFPFPLPTTGALSLTDFLIDPSPSGKLAVHLAHANSARAHLRAVLKEERRALSQERDALAVVKAVESYLPYFYSLTNCLKTDDLLLRTEPVFSWRASLTATLHPNPPRHTFTSSANLLPEETFLLLTYLYSLANLSSSILLSLSNSPTAGSTSSISSQHNPLGGASYELDQTLSTAERKKKDERLGQAADLLCRAAGIGEYLGEKVVGEWERERDSTDGRLGGSKRVGGVTQGPVEGTRTFALGLSKLLLGSAHLLSLRKLLAPSLSLSPHLGPPLARTHPSPSLLSKLYLYTTDLFSSSLALLSSSTSSSSSSSPNTDLVRWLKETTRTAEGLNRKWLGVDAGESSGGLRIGEAVVWLKESQRILESIGTSSSSSITGSGGGGGEANSGGSRLGSKSSGLFGKSKKIGKEEKKERLARVHVELEAVEAFLSAYEKANNSVYFQPLPSLSALLPRVPAGRAVLASKPFSPPKPAFGPGSEGYVSRAEDDRQARDDEQEEKGEQQEQGGKREGGGGYF